MLYCYLHFQSNCDHCFSLIYNLITKAWKWAQIGRYLNCYGELNVKENNFCLFRTINNITFSVVCVFQLMSRALWFFLRAICFLLRRTRFIHISIGCAIYQMMPKSIFVKCTYIIGVNTRLVYAYLSITWTHMWCKQFDSDQFFGWFGEVS